MRYFLENGVNNIDPPTTHLLQDVSMYKTIDIVFFWFQGLYYNNRKE
jgi:hypothetical protein